MNYEWCEDDERIEEIEARFEAGEKHATQPPSIDDLERRDRIHYAEWLDAGRVGPR